MKKRKELLDKFAWSRPEVREFADLLIRTYEARSNERDVAMNRMYLPLSYAMQNSFINDTRSINALIDYLQEGKQPPPLPRPVIKKKTKDKEVEVAEEPKPAKTKISDEDLELIRKIKDPSMMLQFVQNIRKEIKSNTDDFGFMLHIVGRLHPTKLNKAAKLFDPLDLCKLLIELE